ncbi:MAG: hypothetical protein Q8O99_07320 [bacterium]|nr:hypothetical protein [bacterium]
MFTFGTLLTKLRREKQAIEHGFCFRCHFFVIEIASLIIFCFIVTGVRAQIHPTDSG